MRPGKMVRGSITWHKKIEPEDTGKLYPGLVRTVDWKRIGRRVRVGQREIMELLERLRHEELYDYEATAEGYLVRIGLEEEYGKA